MLSGPRTRRGQSRRCDLNLAGPPPSCPCPRAEQGREKRVAASHELRPPHTRRSHRPDPRRLAGPDRGQHARQTGRTGRGVDPRAHRRISAPGRRAAADRLPARARRRGRRRRAAPGVARLRARPDPRQLPRRRRGLHRPRTAPAGDARLRLQHRGRRRAVAAAAPLSPDLHGGAGGVPQSRERTAAAADGDVRQPVPGVDRRPHPRRRLRLDLPRRSRPRRRSGPP
ncbi:hypothetical protein SGPA1_10539 [Streptomyces misionensis JCM 4497]